MSGTKRNYEAKRNRLFAKAIEKYIEKCGVGIEAKSPGMVNIKYFRNTIINLGYEWPSKELSEQEVKLLKPVLITLQADYEDTLQYMVQRHIKKEKQDKMREKIDYIKEILQDIIQKSTE